MSLKKKRKRFKSKSAETKEILAERLNKVCTFLDDTYDINAGGCCYIAYCLAKLLERDNMKYKIVVYEDYKIGGTFNQLSVGHYHYAIALGRAIINPMDDDTFVINKYQVSSSDILKHYNREDWNDCYDTSKNLFINKILKNFYYDLTEDLREN
ncbi:MAG: hypothetical protein ACI4OP_07130 [Candidatus Coprovivens sp.]